MAQLPAWQPLGGGVPVPDGDGRGRIVAVVASQEAIAGGWAAAATLDMARAWSSKGERVIVADCALHYPTLHTQARLENGEGLSDAALFGASVSRVARPIEGGAYFLITAGTAVADANSVPTSPRWGRLLEGFRDAGVTLVLFLRDGDSGCSAFLGSASDIVVLSPKGERAPAAVRHLETRVRAVAGTEAAPARPAPGVRPPPEARTGKRPEGRHRVRLLVGAAMLAVLLLILAFTVLL